MKQPLLDDKVLLNIFEKAPIEEKIKGFQKALDTLNSLSFVKRSNNRIEIEKQELSSEQFVSIIMLRTMLISEIKRSFN